MATTFKTFLNNDIATTRTLLHEAIPVTGSIASGTYADQNIKNYAHGMFQSVYDYPFLSSSANHIFDITCGFSSDSALSRSNGEQVAKKINIYNQMAQVLVGYDTGSNIQPFDRDGDISAGGTKFKECVFINFARLLAKDEIKKGSFAMSFITGGTPGSPVLGPGELLELADHGAANSFKVNSPAGEYGLIFTSSAATSNPPEAWGHVYYQAGIVVLTASVFRQIVDTDSENSGTTWGSGDAEYDTSSAETVLSGGTIENFADGFRNRLFNLEFNNTTELNSTIYFTRANTGDYNYSSNPTYLTASKIRVKGNNPLAEPVSYITTVGLYSADNELLAVAKLSEPLKKTPSNELTLRVRLDY